MAKTTVTRVIAGYQVAAVHRTALRGQRGDAAHSRLAGLFYLISDIVKPRRTAMGDDAGHKVEKSSHAIRVQDRFRHFAHRMARVMGSPWSFFIAVLVVIGWGVTGPLFHFSNSWQLVINTGTTIVTFLMVFLIQNTQNRDAKAFDLKLDELIRAVKGARNEMLNLEGLTDEDLAELKREYDRICRRSKAAK